MHVLVTGGAGYIGSVVVEHLVAAGHSVIAYDDFSKGHRASIGPHAKIVEGRVEDQEKLRRAFAEHEIEAVVHMAALSLVGESMVDPRRYYAANVAGGLTLLDAMIDSGVKNIVFSSTAAVYDAASPQPLVETSPTLPGNTYGSTKLAFEAALQWYGTAYGLRHVTLRYFNAAGATRDCGEDHDPETHLIPLILGAATGRSPAVTIFGDDYPTADGTCVRDYIHVSDLARAHILALTSQTPSSTYNLGCGRASSVREVIAAAERVTGRRIPTAVGARRPGDPAVLIASSARIERARGWVAESSDLETIIESAWRWRQAYPNGYPP